MESEIRVLIDSVLKSLEPERTKKPQKKKKKEEEKKEKKEKILERLEDQYKTVSGKMKKKVQQKGWENMKPKNIFNRIVYDKQLLGKVSSTRAGIKKGLKKVAGLDVSNLKCLSSECRKEFSSWKSARKKKRENLIKKSLV